MKKIVLLVAIMIFATIGFAQKTVKVTPKKVEKKVTAQVNDDEGKTKIRIEKNVNGKIEVIEKVIDSNDIDKIDDEIETSITEDIMGNEDEMPDPNYKKEHRVIIRKGHDDIARNHERMDGNPQRMDEFNFHMDRFHDKMAELPGRMRNLVYDDKFLTTNNNKSIKGLEVFTNKPETSIVNVRFYAPEEGDVNISVLDIKGDVITKSEAKKFQGEYVGQVKIPSDKKGVFFVIVAQNNDGISRKLKVE